MAKEELYKINGRKLNEHDACQAMQDGLTFLIETNNVLLKSLNGIPEDIESIEYTSPLSDKLIDLLNKNWDTQIKTEKEKCVKDIMSNKFKSIVADVNTSLKLQPKTIKMVDKLSKQAASTNDERYSFELLKFIQKVLQDSNEIFENQYTYANKHLQLIFEAE